MEEVKDFEGFTPDECEITLKLINSLKHILNTSLSNASTKIRKKKKRGRGKSKCPSQSQFSQDKPDQTNLLTFWELRDQSSTDTPHTVLDHAHWFKKVLEDYYGQCKSKDLTYQNYIKLVSLESSVNTTMFISDSNELTSQRLWDQLVHRVTAKGSKYWMERTLNISPLFYLFPHRKVWERTGQKSQGKKLFYF